MLLASSPDTLTFSIGAVATLVGFAIGYGTLRAKVTNLGETILRLEREQVATDKSITDLNQWKSFTEGRQSVAKSKARARNRDDDTG